MSASVEFGLPVSKSKFLSITHDFERERQWTALVEAGKEEEAKKLRESVPVTHFKKLDGETTAKLREGIIRSAPRFIFCPDENQDYTALLAKEPWTLRMQVGW